MEEKKYHIEKNTVQETLIIPLWGRKFATEVFPELYTDPTAVKLASMLDYDFSSLEEKTGSFGYRFGYLRLLSGIWTSPRSFGPTWPITPEQPLSIWAAAWIVRQKITAIRSAESIISTVRMSLRSEIRCCLRMRGRPISAPI